MKRVILPELLDDAEPEGARQSLHDLVKINRYLGGHRVLRALIREQKRQAGATELSVLDVGAASGDMAQIWREEMPGAKVTAFDYRVSHLEKAQGVKVAGNAFALPFREHSFDVVFSSLFLHHFSDAQVVELLAGFARVARRGVWAIDLDRGMFSYWFLPATTWLFRWHPITLHDGPISVAAGFRKPELKMLAEKAGLGRVEVRVHRPWARLSLVAAASS